MKRMGKRGGTLYGSFQRAEKGWKDALCLGDKLMKLADEIIEDKLAAAHRDTWVLGTYTISRGI
jgi:hypothetical protein